jgi:hypothetical protein
MFLQAGAGDQDRSGNIQLGKPTFCGPESLARLEIVSGISTGRPRMLMREHVSCRQEIRNQHN